ncbi:MAG: hypothetical protein AAFN30_11150 [Actinomycetota bacterium]
MTGSNGTDRQEQDFARRAATYLREQGLTDDEVQAALVAELGLKAPEVEQVMSQAEAA